MKVFQITQADIDRSSTLEAEDLGKWCYIVQGAMQGFFSTEEAAMPTAGFANASYEYVFGRHG
ncbi:MAG: hypothetical protein ACYTXF_33285 [Nostoc sp.]